MRIALAQVCSTGDVPANLELVRDRVAEAAARGARLVVFPEATISKVPMARCARMGASARPMIGGPSMTTWS